MTAETKTFRAKTLADALAQVRAELGADAVVVRRREGLQGGVGGFFQKAVIEVDAHAGAPAIDFGGDDAPAMPEDFELEAPAAAPLAAQAAPAPQAPPAPAPQAAPAPVVQTLAREAAAAGFAAALATATRTPGPTPYTDVAIDALPAVTDTPPEVTPFTPPKLMAPVMAQPTGEHPEAERVTATLRRAGVSDAFAAELVAEATVHGLPFADEAPARLRPLVARALARRLDVAPLHGPGAVAVVGGAGSGKTAVVARLAAAYAAAGTLPVAVIALRPKDGGAELARLLAPAGVPLSATDDVAGAAARIANLRHGALVLVDTPALPPRAGAERDALVAELRQLGLDEVHLAVPAVFAGDVARELLAAGRDLGAERIAITHADEAARLGMAVELAAESRVPVSYLADTASIRPAAADDIAFALLP